jgi:hypothetical protein
MIIEKGKKKIIFSHLSTIYFFPENKEKRYIYIYIPKVYEIFKKAYEIYKDREDIYFKKAFSLFDLFQLFDIQ